MSRQSDMYVLQTAQDGWPSVKTLNAGAFYLSKSLHLSLSNQLAGRLLNVDTAIGEVVPLASCLSVKSEEYRLLLHMMTCEREYRDFVVNWECDGLARHVLIDSFAQMDEQGRFQGMYVLMKDLGNFAALEKKIKKTDTLATIGKVAAGVAHEIRNPLTTIKGFLQMLEHRFSEQQREDELAYAKVMLSDLTRVESLIAELLFLSKPHRIEQSACSIQEILEEIRLAIEPQATENRIEQQFSLQCLPEILANGPLLKQAIYKVVENALEAMEHGGILRLQAYTKGNFIEIDVSDTGPGIPYYMMDKIFDAFYTTKEKGSGLGLPICQRILADHGGEIRVSSKGFGTTVSLLLPCSR